MSYMMINVLVLCVALHVVLLIICCLLQVVGVAAATVGLAIGLRTFDALHDSLHAELGLAIGCLIWAQPLVALLLRPKK